MTERREQTFFPDPALDRALAMIMTLAAELHVTRDHVKVLEALLVAKDIIKANDVDDFAPSVTQAAQFDADRDTFVATLMRHAQGLSPEPIVHDS